MRFQLGPKSRLLKKSPNEDFDPNSRFSRATTILARSPLSGSPAGTARPGARSSAADRKSTRLNSSHLVISYAVFCLKKKITNNSDAPIIPFTEALDQDNFLTFTSLHIDSHTFVNAHSIPSSYDSELIRTLFPALFDK